MCSPSNTCQVLLEPTSLPSVLDLGGYCSTGLNDQYWPQSLMLGQECFVSNHGGGRRKENEMYTFFCTSFMNS